MTKICVITINSTFELISSKIMTLKLLTSTVETIVNEEIIFHLTKMLLKIKNNFMN